MLSPSHLFPPSPCAPFPSFPVSGPFLPDVPGFKVPSDSVFPSQPRSSSRALPILLHFCKFLLGCEPFQPSHDHRYRFHPAPCFLQDLLISTIVSRLTPIVHHTILISVVAIRFSSLTDVGLVSQPESNAGQITGSHFRSFLFIGTFLTQNTYDSWTFCRFILETQLVLAANCAGCVVAFRLTTVS